MTGADRYILEIQIRDARNAVEKYSKHRTSQSIHVVREASRKLEELERKLRLLQENGL